MEVEVGVGLWEGFGGGTGFGMGEGIELREVAGLEVGVRERAGTGRG